MKKLLAILLFVTVLATAFSCTEEEVGPGGKGDGGTSKPSGF